MSVIQKEEQEQKKGTDRLMLVGLLVVLGLAVLVALVLPKFVFNGQDGGELFVESEESRQVLYRHPLTGAAMYEEIPPPQVFAVMVDNHFDAWPPVGIDEAFLVIEAPFEAGIPRMIAFFSEEQDVEQIGPVRSARPYCLDWVAELDALYAHVGGSPEALDLIASGGTFDLNEYWWGGTYFWRSRDRYAPHNTFTSTERMRDFYLMRDEAGVAPTRLYDVWSFKDPEPTNDSESSLRVAFSSPVYVVDWIYNQETGRYDREQYDQPHVTDEGTQIAADNVAVVITDVRIIDSVGRRDIRTIGEGDGYVLQDGRVIEVTWKKPSASERLKFYNRVTDEEIVMNAGVTWIEVVPREDDIEIE